MKQTSRALLAAAISAVCMGTVQTAQANAFNFTFNGTITSVDLADPGLIGTPVSASLVITTAGDASSFESITGVTGTFLGENVTSIGWMTGLPFENTFSANSPYITGDGISIYTDNYGVTFGDGGGQGRYWASTPSYWYSDNGVVSVSAVSAVPEPGTYAMLIAGLGVLGAVSRRQKKKSEPLVAALA